MQQQVDLEALLMPIVASYGLDWVGLQINPAGQHASLRLFIDKPDGIEVEDCVKVSRQANAVLSVEASAFADYALEVSSPGVERPLFNVQQCAEQIGKQVSVRLRQPLDGKRTVKGELTVAEEGKIQVVASSNQTFEFPFANIDQAHIVYEW